VTRILVHATARGPHSDTRTKIRREKKTEGHRRRWHRRDCMGSISLWCCGIKRYGDDSTLSPRKSTNALSAGNPEFGEVSINLPAQARRAEIRKPGCSRRSRQWLRRAKGDEGEGCFERLTLPSAAGPRRFEDGRHRGERRGRTAGKEKKTPDPFLLYAFLLYRSGVSTSSGGTSGVLSPGVLAISRSTIS
jgi:hypothetical protein